MTLTLKISRRGTIRCLYDELLDLSALGSRSIQRASHVEPTSDGRWIADLGLSAGPVLGPFEKRSTALKAEIDWLLSHRLGGS